MSVLPNVRRRYQRSVAKAAERAAALAARGTEPDPGPAEAPPERPDVVAPADRQGRPLAMVLLEEWITGRLLGQPTRWQQALARLERLAQRPGRKGSG
jgi:hypothetical protein